MRVVHLSALLILSVLASVVSAGDSFRLTANENLRWQKGNMHTHSLWSDGDDYAEMIAQWYRQHDYQFLVFTDHNTLLKGERWINVEDSKGKMQAFDKLKAADFPADWVESRTTDGELEVRLKTFDEIFDQLAVPQEFLLIQGEEVSDRFGRLPVHMCVTNTSVVLPPLGGPGDAAKRRRRSVTPGTNRRSGPHPSESSELPLRRHR